MMALWAWLSIFIFSAYAEDPLYLLKKKLPGDCVVRKQNANRVWEAGTIQEIDSHPLKLLKEYPDSGTVLFRLDDIWYGIQKRCLEEIPEEKYLSVNSNFLLISGRVTKNAYTFDNTVYPYNSILSYRTQVWKGVVAGFERKRYVHRFERHYGLAFEVGSSTDSLGRHPVTTAGVKVLGGFGYAIIRDEILAAFEAGVLVRYGDFREPDNQFVGEVPLGLTEEFRFWKTTALKFCESVYPRGDGTSFSLAAGITFDIE